MSCIACDKISKSSFFSCHGSSSTFFFSFINFKQKKLLSTLSNSVTIYSSINLMPSSSKSCKPIFLASSIFCDGFSGMQFTASCAGSSKSHLQTCILYLSEHVYLEEAVIYSILPELSNTETAICSHSNNNMGHTLGEAALKALIISYVKWLDKGSSVRMLKKNYFCIFICTVFCFT